MECFHRFIGSRQFRNQAFIWVYRLCSDLGKLTLLFVLTWHERTKFLLRHILGTINSHLSLKPPQSSLFSFIPTCSLFRINTDIRFAYGISYLVANGTEHAVFLWHPAVTSFSRANGVGEFGVEKYMSAFRAAERKEFVTNPSDYCWLFPIKISTALQASTLHGDLTVLVSSSAVFRGLNWLSFLSKNSSIPSTLWTGNLLLSIFSTHIRWSRSWHLMTLLR